MSKKPQPPRGTTTEFGKTLDGGEKSREKIIALNGEARGKKK